MSLKLKNCRLYLICNQSYFQGRQEAGWIVNKAKTCSTIFFLTKTAPRSQKDQIKPLPQMIFMFFDTAYAILQLALQSTSNSQITPKCIFSFDWDANIPNSRTKLLKGAHSIIWNYSTKKRSVSHLLLVLPRLIQFRMFQLHMLL
jgi:hypothetical protein